MNRTEQVEWEARWARPAAAAAAGAFLVPIVAAIVQGALLERRPGAGETRLFLELYDRQTGVFLIGSIGQAIGLLLLGAVLAYLFYATRFRRRELPNAALALGLVGPLLLAVAKLLEVVDLSDSANEFLASGARTERRADDLARSFSGVTQGFGLGGALALAFSTVQISLSAMRAGLVSRFLGIIGIIVGVLYVLGVLIPAAAPTVVQLFWLGALAALFADRWPGGRGPAWAAGEAVPWPSAMEQAKAREEAARQPEIEEPSAERPRRKKRR